MNQRDKDKYAAQKAQWLEAVKARRDAQTVLDRAIAREHELAGRLIHAAKDL